MKFTNYEHIKQWEGLKLEAYQDSGGVWTIGFGHTKGVKPGQKISLEEAKRLLEEDLEWAVETVNKGVTREINQNQFDALVSLCYNIGATAFLKSTTLKRFNNGDLQGAAIAITWWNKVGKKVVQGLVNRREAERNLFLTPTNDRVEIEARLALLEQEFLDQVEIVLDSFVRRYKEIINVR